MRIKGKDAAREGPADLELSPASDGNAQANQDSAYHASKMRHLAANIQHVLRALHRLEHLNLQGQNIPIPRCLVLGEQSTGKSSVIEAISGIQTPRADDTCTRCPLWITCNPDENERAQWLAKISLKRDYTWTGGKGHAQHRFAEWTHLNDKTHMIHFATTDDPEKLGDLIARAQIATISPLVDHQEFLPPVLPDAALHRCEFSPNVVFIEISGPGLPPLSFYDLPGLIGQAADEKSAHLPRFVEDLVQDYIRDPEALILVVCSLENDVANSKAGRIARELYAEDRCIGILTKPDRLPAGSRHHKIQEILDGKSFALGHGYFVVKNLGQDHINQGIRHGDARDFERQFFETEAPWSTAFAHYQHRFGTTNLAHFLSAQFAKQIMTKLPIIEQSIAARRHYVETELSQFLEPPANPQRKISDELRAFSEHVRSEVECGFNSELWVKSWKQDRTVFFNNLMALKPTLHVVGTKDSGIYLKTVGTGAGGSRDNSMIIDDDGDEDEDGEGQAPVPTTPSNKRKAQSTPAPSTPTKSQKVAHPPTSVTTTPVTEQGLRAMRTQYNVDEIERHLDHHSKARVPGQVDPRVLNSMMLNTLVHWHIPLEQFFEALQEHVTKQIQTIFKVYFDKWQGSSLYQAAWSIIAEMLKLNFEQQRTVMAADSLTDEKEDVHLFHEDVFNRERSEMLMLYSIARINIRLKKFGKEREEQTGKPFLPKDEAQIRKDQQIMAVIQSDPYSREVEAMAQITAYYKIAACRFHDAVCIRIETKFFKQLRTKLYSELEERLGIFDSENGHRNCFELLAESVEREHRRRELLTMKQALDQGQLILDELKVHHGSSTIPRSRSGTVDSFGQRGSQMPTPSSEEMDEDI